LTARHSRCAFDYGKRISSQNPFLLAKLLAKIRTALPWSSYRMVLLFLATRGTLRPALAPPSHLPVVHKRSQKRISSCFFFFRIRLFADGFVGAVCADGFVGAVGADWLL
jgi:hypothetical protein